MSICGKVLASGGSLFKLTIVGSYLTCGSFWSPPTEASYAAPLATKILPLTPNVLSWFPTGTTSSCSIQLFIVPFHVHLAPSTKRTCLFWYLWPQVKICCLW